MGRLSKGLQGVVLENRVKAHSGLRAHKCVEGGNCVDAFAETSRESDKARFRYFDLVIELKWRSRRCPFR